MERCHTCGRSEEICICDHNIIRAQQRRQAEPFDPAKMDQALNRAKNKPNTTSLEDVRARFRGRPKPEPPPQPELTTGLEVFEDGIEVESGGIQVDLGTGGAHVYTADNPDTLIGSRVYTELCACVIECHEGEKPMARITVLTGCESKNTVDVGLNIDGALAGEAFQSKVFIDGATLESNFQYITPPLRRGRHTIGVVVRVQDEGRPVQVAAKLQVMMMRGGLIPVESDGSKII